MIRKLLVANRGEIACRIMHTARRLGVPTVAVYSSADREAQHVQRADEAVWIGAAPATDSYLKIDALLAAAAASGADAIHPGYGFLSENADFAGACSDAGVCFVGPPAAAIRTMGSKQAAKALLESAEVPLIPGYHGSDQTDARLSAAAEDIGFPLLIKASAGGGGKGMRRVDAAADFDAALGAARREAAAAFGDDRMLLEKLLIAARHVEVQVFADDHGNVVHLLERDCSLQRRHQKVIEEAPAPGLDDATRTAMGAAAIAVARAVDYRGAGTVEFIMDGDGFYFMEMNTRLQVEHPVTELITGTDLVEWQLRVASGEPLPLRQNEIVARGAAVEARLYAENPARRFLPVTGQISHLRFPVEAEGVRVDSGVTAGDRIGIHYDPMIAKVIAWGPDRASAIQRLNQALAATELAGLVTNLPFLRALLQDAAFQAGAAHTQYLDEQLPQLLEQLPAPSPLDLALASLVAILRHTPIASTSPWVTAGAWRLKTAVRTRVGLRQGRERWAATLSQQGDEWSVSVNEGPAERIRVLQQHPGRLRFCHDGLDGELSYTSSGDGLGNAITLFRTGTTLGFDIEPDYQLRDDTGAAGGLRAPMPGNVTAVLVAPGDRVEAGQTLIVLEAMKMEHRINAPRAGRVAAVHCKVGDAVEENVPLAALAD